MRVDVYKNLHKGCFSVRCMEPGRYYRKVLKYTNCIALRDARLLVSEAGKMRVRREKKKNVHAVVRGESFWPRRSEAFYVAALDRPLLATYNPYVNDTFVLLDDTPVLTAPMVRLKDGKLWVYSPNNVYEGID